MVSKAPRRHPLPVVDGLLVAGSSAAGPARAGSGSGSGAFSTTTGFGFFLRSNLGFDGLESTEIMPEASIEALRLSAASRASRCFFVSYVPFFRASSRAAAFLASFSSRFRFSSSNFRCSASSSALILSSAAFSQRQLLSAPFAR